MNVTSPAVDSAHYNSSFDDVKIYFNDTVHDVYIEYNYLTASTYFVGTLNDGIVTFAASTAELTYDQALGTYTATVDFFIQFNSNALDAQNRAIWVQACLVNGSCVGYGTAPISAPFNIINQGGLTNTIAKGTCAHTAGGDIFADTCTYSYVGSKIQTNATFYNLQSFSTQFSMTSGGTATNSSQKALTQRFGFYFWDGSTWVLGPNVLIAVLKGHAYSSEGGYTLYETVYYYGATLISNQTVSVYLEPTTPAQNRFYVDMWYSNINASTTWGMRVERVLRRDVRVRVVDLVLMVSDVHQPVHESGVRLHIRPRREALQLEPDNLHEGLRDAPVRQAHDPIFRHDSLRHRAVQHGG